MDVTINKLYLYDNIRHLMVIGDNLCLCKDNAPMTKNKIKLHRGIDNKLSFRTLGPDRIPVDISCDQQVYARIMDPENKAIVLEKLCRIGPAKGVITLEVDSGDIIDVHAGFYTMVLVRTEEFVSTATDYYIEKPIFTDFDSNVSIEVEITDQALKAPVSGATLLPGDWTPDVHIPNSGSPVYSFYSPRIPASRVKNHKESIHSISTYTENFTGTLEIWGTLEDSPDPYIHNRWFKIYTADSTPTVEYISYTGTKSWTFSANVMWLKFRYYPSSSVLDPGVLKKLIVRS